MPIYLDYNATAPIRPEVLARMQELQGQPLNASSAHSFGRAAKKELEAARKIIADNISAWPDEIIFTASATEANNTVLRGTNRRVLVSAIEHSSVLSPSPWKGEGSDGGQKSAENLDPHLTPPPSRGRNNIISVTSDGVVDLSALEKMLAENPNALVSVMLANNETGVIQPVSEVAAICKKHGAIFHCDAVQGLGKIPVDFGAIGADMMTITSHKCGGPVGAAVLVVKRGAEFSPLLLGGGQEGRRRAGTENIAAITGFAKAVELIDFAHMQKLRTWLDGMEHVILSAAKDLLKEGDSSPSAQNDNMIFGSNSPRLPNTSCIAMPGVSNEVQLMDFDLQGFAVSAGSACSSGRIEVSHVLTAMGVDKALAGCAIRVSSGWNTVENDVKLFTQAWKTLYSRLAK